MKEQGTNNLLQSLNPFKSTLVDRRGINDNVKLIIKPLRIFQFLVVLLIFVFVIYAIATGNTELSAVTCILLIVLSGVYVFVLAVELISHFSGGELYAIPIFVLSILGVIFFGVAGILLIPVYINIKLWYIITTLCLCLLAFILFLIDVIVILVFWKQACRCKQCIYPGQADVQLNDQIFCHPLCETMKHDLMTSVSNIRIPLGEEEGTPVHCYRKIGHARRRQYVDRPSSAKSRSVMDIAKCQTESPVMTNIESQTQYFVTETPTQTVSKCELCHRQMEIFSTPGDVQPICHQKLSCAPCPTYVQLIREMPCCKDCRCVAGLVQMPQQIQQQQISRQDQDQLIATNDVQWMQQDQRTHGMLTSEREEVKMMGVSGTVTKLTVASYCVTPSRKPDMSSQTVDEETRSTNSRRATEDTGERKEKRRSSATQKERPREVSIIKPEVFILEGEKEKVRISVGIEKEMIKQPPSKSASKSSTARSMKSISRQSAIEEKSAERTYDKSRSVIEDQSETVLKSGDPALVSPPQKVAQMIELLQEIEGTKSSAETNIVLMTEDKEKPNEDAIKETEKSEVEEVNEEVLQEEEVVTERVIEEMEQKIDKERSQEFKPTLEDEISVDKPAVEREFGDSGRKSAERLKEKSIDSDVTISSADESSICFGKLKDELMMEGSTPRQPSDKKREMSVETSSSVKPDAETQATDTDRSSHKSKKTSFLKKKNKVEPSEQVHSDMQSQTWCSEPSCEASVVATSRLDNERFIVDKKGVIGEVSVCPSCRRIQHFSASPSIQYYSVYRDKRGRLYCDYCFPSRSIKVLYKHDVCELKSLKCSRCGNLLRQKTSRSEGAHIRNRTDTCPKCAQTQFRSYSVGKK